MTDTRRTRSYLYDLYVVPMWRNRFDQFFLDQVKLPVQGRVLLMECGTGGLALELAQALKDTGSITASDRDDDQVELARAKLAMTDITNLEFMMANQVQSRLTANTYELALGDASLLHPSQIEPMLRSLHKTLTVEGKAVLYTITRGSFDEFFSIYWEALYECGLANQLQVELETLLLTHPTGDEIHDLAKVIGLRNVQIVTKKEEFTFPNGEGFLTSPIIDGYWLDHWLAILPTAEDVVRVKQAIQGIIDGECSEFPFEMSIKASIVMGSRR